MTRTIDLPGGGTAEVTGADHALVRRVAAAQATRDQWWEQPFRLGHADCVRMVASHLRRMGHKVRLPAAGSYRGPRAALMKLKAQGHDSLVAALDAMGFERIAPAAALVGDVLALQGDVDQFEALTVALGNGRVLGWHDDAPGGACVLQPEAMLAAWRIEPVMSGRGG